MILSLTLTDVAYFTLVLLAVGSTVKSFELIAISSLFEDNKPHDWNLVGLDALQACRLNFLFKAVYSKRGFITVCGISVMSLVMAMMLFYHPVLFPACMILYFLCQLIIHHRQQFGGDGADQMSFIILVTYMLCFVFTGNETIRHIGIIFISGQLVLSYVVAGIAKMVSVEWRNGTAIQGILSSYTYGTELTRRFFSKNLQWAKVMGWG
jgi:hypothetical protein